MHWLTDWLRIQEIRDALRPQSILFGDQMCSSTLSGVLFHDPAPAAMDPRALMEIRVRRPAELFRIVGALDVEEEADFEWFLLMHPFHQQIWLLVVRWEEGRVKTMEILSLAALQRSDYDPPQAVLQLLESWLDHFLAYSNRDGEVDAARSA